MYRPCYNKSGTLVNVVILEITVLIRNEMFLQNKESTQVYLTG